MSDLDHLKKLVEACHDEAERTNDTVVSGAELDAYLLTVEPARSLAAERDRLELQRDVAVCERDLLLADAKSLMYFNEVRERGFAARVERTAADRIAKWLDEQGTPELAARVRVGEWSAPAPPPASMRLVWHQRKDGLWNAACACNATVCGVEFDQRAAAEAAHFDLARTERAHRTAHPDRFEGNQIPACGPKLPETNPNLPDPFVFP